LTAAVGTGYKTGYPPQFGVRGIDNQGKPPHDDHQDTPWHRLRLPSTYDSNSGYGRIRGTGMKITTYSITKKQRELQREAAEAARDNKKIKPETKLADGHGLYLLIRLNGDHVWRHKFNFGTFINKKGKRAPYEQLATLGTYPLLSIADARSLHDDNRQMLRQGVNPMAHKREARITADASTKNTVAQVAERYIKNQEHVLAPKTISKARWQVRLIEPSIGSIPVADLKGDQVIAAIRKIEARGTPDGKRSMIETSHKTLELIARVLDFAIDEGLIESETNVARGRSRAIKARVERHFPAIIDEPGIAKLLRAIDGYEGQPATVAALKILPHIFLRSSELRGGKWSEIDFDAATWLIPAERMKGKRGKKREHLVPLSRQSLAILKGLHEITGDQPLLFPAVGAKKRPISDGTLGMALRAIGYTSEQMVPHGFRTTFSTRMNEMGYPESDIELQLSHRDENEVRRAYNRAVRIKERARMLQEWSDYLDMLRAGGTKVVSIHSRRRAT
jgi:integrase